METYERGRPGTDIEQDLGGPGASVEAADTATADVGSGSVAGATPSAGGEPADVEQDVSYPGDAYTGESPATDPTQR